MARFPGCRLRCDGHRRLPRPGPAVRRHGQERHGGAVGTRRSMLFACRATCIRICPQLAPRPFLTPYARLAMHWLRLVAHRCLLACHFVYLFCVVSLFQIYYDTQSNTRRWTNVAVHPTTGDVWAMSQGAVCKSLRPSCYWPADFRAALPHRLYSPRSAVLLSCLDWLCRQEGAGSRRHRRHARRGHQWRVRVCRLPEHRAVW